MKKGLFLVLACVLLVACESDEDNKINSAQNCLDTANPGNVQVCMDKVAGISSSKASIIRCAGLFIQQGMTTTSFANAFTQLKGTTTNGQNNMLGMMGYLAFNNAQKAADAQTECNNSGQLGLQMFGNVAYMATTIASAGSLLSQIQGGTPPTQAQMLTAVQGMSAASDTALGTAAVSISQSYCVGSQATSPVCQSFNSAVSRGGGNLAAIGAQLRTYSLQNPNP